MKVLKVNYEEEIKKCKTMDDVVGKNRLMQKLFKEVIQQLLEAEMYEKLGWQKYERSADEQEDSLDYRNGHSQKIIRSNYEEIPIDVPRDRKSQFDPKVIKKYDNDCSEFDNKVIGLYPLGISTRDIQSELNELYGIEISPDMISNITDKVYPIVYMDAVHFKVRDEHRIL